MKRLLGALPWIGAAVVIAIVASRMPILRGPAFHHYADHRAWLGIPNAGDVLSNLAFVAVAVFYARRARGFALVVCASIFAIGVGSGAYHLAPSDTTLAFDWAPIVVTLALVTATVIDDRYGRRAGVLAAIAGSLAAISTVALWWIGGGTSGGDMGPYVIAQGLGVVLPPLIAVSRPGQIATAPLIGAVLCFAAARWFQARDGELLTMLGISGHSLKHVAAAVAAAIATHALCDRESRSR